MKTLKAFFKPALLCHLYLFLATGCFSQTVKSPSFESLLINNFKLPPSFHEKTSENRVAFSFDVTTSGAITNLKTIFSTSPEIEQELLKVLTNLRSLSNIANRQDVSLTGKRIVLPVVVSVGDPESCLYIRDIEKMNQALSKVINQSEKKILIIDNHFQYIDKPIR